MVFIKDKLIKNGYYYTTEPFCGGSGLKLKLIKITKSKITFFCKGCLGSYYRDVNDISNIIPINKITRMLYHVV